jgi:beta-phosphoglucomutase
MLKAVIFDLDGVITDTAKYHFIAWKKLADSLGIPFDESYNEKLKGVSRMESLNLILERGKGTEAYSKAEKEKMAFEKNEEYKKLISTMTPSDILEGIETLLKELKGKGIKTGLASVSKNAPFIIDRLQLRTYFDYMADAGKIMNAKPYPDIFLDCSEHLGIEPEECIGIEDAAAGIEAIKRAGMKAVGVGTADQMQKADRILSGTKELSLKVLQEVLA